MIPNVIPKPMLAHSKSPDLTKLSYPLVGQPKYDGVRCMIAPAGSAAAVPVSRTLKVIPNREIQDVLSRPEFVGLDGELIVGDPTAPDCYNRTTSFVMSRDKTGEPWAFYVFDLWNSPAPYGMRYGRLELTVARWTHTDVPIFTVPTRRLNSIEDVDQYEADLLAAGHEGAILRDPSGLYKHGRSGKNGPLLKLKRFIDFEARVVGVYEELHNGNEAKTNALGRTERSSHAAGKSGKGTLGGLVLVAVNGPAEGIEFRCGTGFDADTRADLWRQAAGPQALDGARTCLNGRTAKIKSFPIGAKDKPRHPVFLGWRDMEIDG